MANRKVTKDVSDNIIAAAVLSSFWGEKSQRLIEAHATEKGKVTVNKGGYYIPLLIGDSFFLIDTATHVDAATDIDTGALEAGKDYFVYACDNNGTLVFKTSLASTFPDGFAADTSRKIGGFHTLCADVGVIAGHSLSGYVNKDILPASIWDLKHRARCGNNAGMVYDAQAGIWIDIYMASGTGASTLSVNGGTISDSRNWMDFVDDGGAIGKRLLNDYEFQLAAEGSNQKTNIAETADPVTTGGHSDTAGRRMISNIGCEDCCGAMWQWLLDQSYRYDPDGTSAAALKTATVTHDAAPGGNAIYLQSSAGIQFLACNMSDGADKVVTFGGSYTVIVKHLADPATGGLQVYFDDDGSQPNRLLVNNTLTGKTVYLPTSNPDYWLPVVHNANAAVTGVAINFDVADNRLEGTLPSGANQTIDLSVGTGWSWVDVGGNKGQLNKQGVSGDVKLVAGGDWSNGASCGSRSRNAYHYRWFTHSRLGARFASEPI